jgi:hypothetical protein
MSTERHHFRKAYKSDFLCSADIEDFIEQGRKLVFTVKEVKQEFNKSINGKKVDVANIAYFADKDVKPLVLNAGNSSILRNFATNKSPIVEDWKNIVIELYVDSNVKFGKDTTSGVRIRPVQPTITKPQFTEANFEKAKANNATIEKIKTIYEVTLEIEKLYGEYCSKK